MAQPSGSLHQANIAVCKNLARAGTLDRRRVEISRIVGALSTDDLFRSGIILDHLHRTPGELRNHLLWRPVGDCWIFTAIQQRVADDGGLLNEVIVLEPGVRREVGHVHAEVRIEAMIDRSATDPPDEIDLLPERHPLRADFLGALPERQRLVGVAAIVRHPVPAQVPFAEARGALALVA